MHGLPAYRLAYPEIEPHATVSLDVGDGHVLHVEECGQRSGRAAVVIHGGPGGGSSPAMRRFFDPQAWRVILYDQRGCGRSRPTSSLEANDTWRLVEDLERIRSACGVRRWTLFGGSWGSTLALLYAQAYPERVSGLVLRGVFLMTPAELDWFYRGGAGAFLPEAWERFLAPLSASEREEPIAAYYDRLTGSNLRRRAQAARTWTEWETAALSSSGAPLVRRAADPSVLDALARIECHFFHHGGFLDRPDQIIARADRLAGIATYIIQGRLDLVTPPRAAAELAAAIPGAALRIVPGAGHSASDPGIVDGLVRATDALARRSN